VYLFRTRLAFIWFFKARLCPKTATILATVVVGITSLTKGENGNSQGVSSNFAASFTSLCRPGFSNHGGLHENDLLVTIR